MQAFWQINIALMRPWKNHLFYPLNQGSQTRGPQTSEKMKIL